MKCPEYGEIWQGGDCGYCPHDKACKEKRVVEADKSGKLNNLLIGLTEVELKTLRAKINGKLGKRKISLEAQARMQAGRKKKPD